MRFVADRIYQGNMQAALELCLHKQLLPRSATVGMPISRVCVKSHSFVMDARVDMLWHSAAAAHKGSPHRHWSRRYVIDHLFTC